MPRGTVNPSTFLNFVVFHVASTRPSPGAGWRDMHRCRDHVSYVCTHALFSFERNAQWFKYGVPLIAHAGPVLQASIEKPRWSALYGSWCQSVFINRRSVIRDQEFF